MSSPQLVLEHPLQGSSLDKQNVAGQLVRIYSDYFDDSITSTIELKEVHLEGDAGGLFSVTYYTAVTAMRLIRGATPGLSNASKPVSASFAIPSSPVHSSSPTPPPSPQLLPASPLAGSPVPPSALPVPTAPAVAVVLRPPAAIDIGKGRPSEESQQDQYKKALEASGRMRDRALELSIEISASLNEVQMHYIRDTCFSLSRDYLKPLLRHVFVDQRLSATLSTSLSIILIQWVPIWIISHTDISDLKLCLINVVIGAFAEFLEDYERVRKNKDGVVTNDEAVIVKGFAALFASRKQRFLFADGGSQADVKERIVEHLFEITTPIIESVTAKTSDLKEAYAAEMRELIIGPLGILEEAVASLLSPAMLYELVQFLIGKLEGTAKTEKEKAKAKPTKAAPAKPKLPPCNVDFRGNFTRLKNVLGAIADPSPLLRGVVDFLCTFFVMDAVQQQIQESLGTLSTPKAKFDIVRTFRNIMWDYNPKTEQWTPIVNPSQAPPSERERESFAVLTKRTMDALMSVISSNNPIGIGTGLLESTVRNLVQCLLAIAQQPRVVQILLYQYLAPRVLCYLK